jgi:hypothetical protein
VWRLPWQHEIQRVNEVGDRTVAEQRHPDNQPDDLQSGKSAAADGRGTRSQERLVDPLGIEVATNTFQIVGRVGGDGAQVVMLLSAVHPSPTRIRKMSGKAS